MPILDTALAFALTNAGFPIGPTYFPHICHLDGDMLECRQRNSLGAGLYGLSALSLPLAWQDWAHPSGTTQSEASRTLSRVHAQPGNLNNLSALSWNLCSD